jgi:hypothetical protein
MAGPCSLDRLAAIAGETEDYLRWCVDVGLLHRQPDGDFDPDSLHRLRLIQFARTRGVSDQQLTGLRPGSYHLARNEVRVLLRDLSGCLYRKSESLHDRKPCLTRGRLAAWPNSAGADGDSRQRASPGRMLG